MLAGREKFLVWLLGGAAVLYVLSRTKQGADALESGIELADIARTQIVNTIVSHGYADNNPGNIRFIASNPWQGQVGSDGGYGVYDTMQNGVRALGHQLLAHYMRRGLDTVRKLVSVWAPSTENDTEAYVNHVSSILDVDPDEVLDVASILPEFSRAIAWHENGYVDTSIDWEWANAA